MIGVSVHISFYVRTVANLEEKNEINSSPYAFASYLFYQSMYLGLGKAFRLSSYDVKQNPFGQMR